MWSVDNIIIMLKEIQKKNNISGNVDAVKFCTELGVSMNGLVYMFSYLFVEAFNFFEILFDLLWMMKMLKSHGGKG